MTEFAYKTNANKPAVTGERTEIDLKSNSIKEADTILLDNSKILSILSEHIPGFLYLYHQISDSKSRFLFASQGQGSYLQVKAFAICMNWIQKM